MLHSCHAYSHNHSINDDIISLLLVCLLSAILAMMGVLFNLGAWLLIVALTVVPVSCQVDCPMFSVSELGATDMQTQGGLIGAALRAASGDPSQPVSVQVHDSRIVCLGSGRTRDMYRGVSVVVNYTCTGSISECTGNPILSQFDFGCNTGPAWSSTVSGSSSNTLTTPPDGTLSTPLRTDCGLCVSPARLGFASITNNDQHCGREYKSNV